MSSSRRVLAVAFARGIGELRSHLLQLGYLPLEVDHLDDAAHEFERGTPLAGPVLVSMNHAERGLRRSYTLRRAARIVRSSGGLSPW